METRVIVSAVIEKDGTFLFGRKRKNIGPYPNTCHLIGGGIEEDESLIAALKREVLEEAGIKIKNIKPIAFDEDYENNKHGQKTHYIFLVFKAVYASGKLKSGDDIVQLEWVPKRSLRKIELNRPSVRLFKSLHLI